jgi:hypothetical protein
VRSATAAAMANILLFAMVNHISPASGKSFESAPAGLGIRCGRAAIPVPQPMPAIVMMVQGAWSCEADAVIDAAA